MIIKQGDQTQNLPDIRRSLTLDVQKYQAMLDNPEMDQSQKAELIETLWMFVISFMDLGCEIKTVETCGKQDPVLDLNERDGSPMLSCKQSRKSMRANFAENAANKEAS